MNFGCEKFLLLNFLGFVGNGIGIPMQEINFLEIRVA